MTKVLGCDSWNRAPEVIHIYPRVLNKIVVWMWISLWIIKLFEGLPKFLRG